MENLTNNHKPHAPPEMRGVAHNQSNKNKRIRGGFKMISLKKSTRTTLQKVMAVTFAVILAKKQA